MSPDGVLLAVALDPLDAAIPCPSKIRLGGPLTKLPGDVGGRRDASGGERQLAPSGKDRVDRRGLAGRHAARGLQLALVPFGPCQRDTPALLLPLRLGKQLPSLAAAHPFDPLALGDGGFEATADPLDLFREISMVLGEAVLLANDRLKVAAASEQLAVVELGELVVARRLMRGDLGAVALRRFGDVVEPFA